MAVFGARSKSEVVSTNRFSRFSSEPSRDEYLHLRVLFQARHPQYLGLGYPQNPRQARWRSQPVSPLRRLCLRAAADPPTPRSQSAPIGREDVNAAPTTPVAMCDGRTFAVLGTLALFLPVREGEIMEDWVSALPRFGAKRAPAA